MNKETLEFLEDIFKIYKKHNMSISHEDGQGSFIIERYDEENVEWLEHAVVIIED